MTNENKPNYVIPNSYQTPNVMIDVLLPLLTDSEWRVLSFAMRHILGWREKIEKRKGTISLHMFENGYGPYPGCGLNKGTIIKALQSLDEHKILLKVGMTKDGASWQLVEDYNQIDIEALEKRLTNKRQKNKKRTEKMLKNLKAKRNELLSHNTGDVLSHNTGDVLSHNTQINTPINTLLNTKDISPEKMGDGDNGIQTPIEDVATSSDDLPAIYECNECKRERNVKEHGRIHQRWDDTLICADCLPSVPAPDDLSANNDNGMYVICPSCEQVLADNMVMVDVNGLEVCNKCYESPDVLFCKDCGGYEYHSKGVGQDVCDDCNASQDTGLTAGHYEFLYSIEYGKWALIPANEIYVEVKQCGLVIDLEAFKAGDKTIELTDKRPCRSQSVAG
jgi:hypothetical protein